MADPFALASSLSSEAASMVAIVVVCVFVAPFGTDTRSLLFARLELEFLLLLAIMFSAVLSANGKFCAKR